MVYASRNTLLVESMEVARNNMGGVRMVTLDGSLIESSGAMTGGSKSRGNRPSFGGSAGGHSSVEKHERLVQESNLLYSTVDAALRETMLNLQDLRNRINNVDGSDHSVKLRNWKADMDRATKSLSEIENKMMASRSEFETCENTKSLKKTEAEQARLLLETALQNRSDSAEALQDLSLIHI